MLLKPILPGSAYFVIIEETNVRGVIMNSDNSVHFNEYNEIVGRGYDGKNEYEYTIFDRQQIEAINLLIQKYNDKDLHRN